MHYIGYAKWEYSPCKEFGRFVQSRFWSTDDATLPKNLLTSWVVVLLNNSINISLTDIR